MKSFAICRLCEQFPPLKEGLSSGMLDLSMVQHNMGHNLTVITRAHPGDLELDSTLPFKVLRIPVKRLVKFGWQGYGEIKRLSCRPDIVHTHGPAAFSYLVRRKNTDPLVVHSVHAVRKYQFELFKELPDLVKSFERTLGSRVIRKPQYFNKLSPTIAKELFLQRYICRKADHLVVVAKYFVDQIVGYYGINREKISISFNGSNFEPIDLTEGDIVRLRSLGINIDKKIILYVGRTDWVKRVHLLIEAMPDLLRAIPDAFLLIIGKGDHDADLPRLVDRLLLKDHVKLLDWIPHRELPKILNIAKCFCLPSYWEGLSKALLEAMSVGLPIIGTENLSNKEVMNDGKFGWLVEESTPKAWSKTIEIVLRGGSDVERKVMNAANLVNEKYRWSHVARRLDAAYENILSAHNHNLTPNRANC